MLINKDSPLSNIIRDGGMMNIFRTIGCIGDSLASGEYEFLNNGRIETKDFFEESWGKHIERITGIKVTNFSHGGLTAYDLYHEADKANSKYDDINMLFRSDNAKQGYIIALGENDMRKMRTNNLYNGILGSANTDICLENYENNAETYVGYYTKIIQRLKTIQPDAKFFLVTMPDLYCRGEREEWAQALYDIADKLTNCYVIDLYHYAPPYDDTFISLYCDGHMNAMGYLITAHYMMTYIDWIIRHTPKEFQYVHLIGTTYKPLNSGSISWL